MNFPFVNKARVAHRKQWRKTMSPGTQASYGEASPLRVQWNATVNATYFFSSGIDLVERMRARWCARCARRAWSFPLPQSCGS